MLDEEKYYMLTDLEKEKFAKVGSFLLAHTFLTREIYETKDKLGKINPDYRFIEKYYEMFDKYFDMFGYTLEKDDVYGIIQINNKYNHNLVRLDKFTTLLLLTLRMIYDDGRSQSAYSSNNAVYTSIGAIIQKMFDLKIITKKPTIKEMSEGFKNINRYNVISKLDKTFEDVTSNLVIMPTIIKVVSNEKINAIFAMVFDNELGTESETISEGN